MIRPALQALLPGLREIAILAAPPRDALQLVATETLTGIDLAINGASPKLPADIRALLSQTANKLNLARLSINGDVAMERTPPILRMGGIDVVPPPGGFVQATAESETAMAKIVVESLIGAEKAVDLFCGAGTFTLPLAAHASVHAVEGEVSGLQALGRAIRKVKDIKPITTEKRNLFRQPLTQIDLSRFDAAVIDPPRAGAEAQTRELALSGIRRIAMVSCNAQTFARDLRILLDAGFKLDRLVPIDQFLWSPHVEIVASLNR